VTISSKETEELYFVRSLYQGLLGREPDPLGLARHLERLGAGAVTKQELAMNFLRSAEFRERSNREGWGAAFIDAADARLFEGYHRRDLQLFFRFDTSGVRPTPGFITDWIGSRVRLTSLWRSAAREGVDRVIQPLPIPGDYHAEAVEWIGVLKAVLAAENSFSVMELGAGFGPWLAASCAAARARGIEDLHLCGVEGEPGRFALLQQNMEDNQLSGADIALHSGAIGVERGWARWPRVARPTEGGGRPLRQDNDEDRKYYSKFPPVKEFIDVEIIPLGNLLNDRELWDLVHIDIQGTEAELSEGCIGELSERARYVVVGTHARWIEGELMKIFLNAGWILENEKPAKLRTEAYTELNYDCYIDGTQVWRNPRLGSHSERAT
jgi:FkbM family methyltransferase